MSDEQPTTPEQLQEWANELGQTIREAQIEVVPKCVTTLAEAYEQGKVVMGGHRAGRTWAMHIATAKPTKTRD